MDGGEEMFGYDRVAVGYAIARPDYPDDVFAIIDEYAGLPERPKVLEVGSGTGQATFQMATRGWLIDAIDPGVHMVDAARALRQRGRCLLLGA